MPARLPPILSWPGKRLPDEDSPSRPLPPVVEHHGPPDAEAALTLVHGDNADVLRALRATHRGAVDLAYLDPPFDTGVDQLRSVRLRHPGAPVVSIPQYGDRWAGDDYLGFMYERLALVRDLLAPHGQIWVHCDARRSHHLRCLLDELFGPSRFLAEIAWDLGNGARGRRFYSLQHNTLIAYARGPTWTFRPDEPRLRVPFAPGSLATHFRERDADGRRIRRRRIGGREYVYRADEGRLIGSVWADIPSMVANAPVMAESTGYPTQKPERLLERILAGSTLPGSCVLDPFLGSGTTAVAAARLGRRFVGIDAAGGAIETALARLAAEPASVQVRAAPASPDGALSVHVEGHRLEVLDLRVPGLRAALGPRAAELDWRALADAVVIDADYDGALLRPTLVDRPGRGAQVRGAYELPAGARRVRVKLTDVAGGVHVAEADLTPTA